MASLTLPTDNMLDYQQLPLNALKQEIIIPKITGKLKLASETWIEQNKHTLWCNYVKPSGVIDLSMRRFSPF